MRSRSGPPRCQYGGPVPRCVSFSLSMTLPMPAYSSLSTIRTSSTSMSAAGRRSPLRNLPSWLPRLSAIRGGSFLIRRVPMGYRVSCSIAGDSQPWDGGRVPRCARVLRAHIRHSFPEIVAVRDSSVFRNAEDTMFRAVAILLDEIGQVQARRGPIARYLRNLKRSPWLSPAVGSPCVLALRTLVPRPISLVLWPFVEIGLNFACSAGPNSCGLFCSPTCKWRHHARPQTRHPRRSCSRQLPQLRPAVWSARSPAGDQGSLQRGRAIGALCAVLCRNREGLFRGAGNRADNKHRAGRRQMHGGASVRRR